MELGLAKKEIEKKTMWKMRYRSVMPTILYLELVKVGDGGR